MIYTGPCFTVDTLIAASFRSGLLQQQKQNSREPLHLSFLLLLLYPRSFQVRFFESIGKILHLYFSFFIPLTFTFPRWVWLLLSWIHYLCDCFLLVMKIMIDWLYVVWLLLVYCIYAHKVFDEMFVRNMGCFFVSFGFLVILIDIVIKWSSNLMICCDCWLITFN